MRAISLASGSKGNCIYVESRKSKILVDIGLTMATVCAKLDEIGVSPKDITAIFITHEHIDHCLGVGAFARKYKTKIYVHTSGYPYVIKKIGNTASVRTGASKSVTNGNSKVLLRFVFFPPSSP